MIYWHKYVVCFHALLISVLCIIPVSSESQIIIDHTCTDITKIPEAAIVEAKSQLHIAYGHTSHGSQITDGMTGLVDFANNGGKGLSLSDDIFAWNNGGTDGALDLEEGDGYGSGWLDHDCGYYPDWVNETREYLDDPSHSDVNVIMWSWCGQVEDKYRSGTLESEYLIPMDQLETDYPEVRFVYMTGHVDHWDDADNKAANQHIRTYCSDNKKVLYDFADIESYDPDGTYYEFPHDNCDYYASADGGKIGNWALEWQDSHTQGVDWYDCGAAHSYPLNSNQKAYAAWWLWAVLAGWEETTGMQVSHPSPVLAEYKLHQNIPNPFNSATNIRYSLSEDSEIQIKIYTVTGKEICTVFKHHYQPKGTFSVTWDATDDRGQKVSSGIYVCVLTVNNKKIIRKMTLLE